MEKFIGNDYVICVKLLCYGIENPSASDTAEGIAKWWVKQPVEKVLPVLEALIRLGVWEKISRDDQILYRPLLNGLQNNETR
jgi:hypothetical protein